MQALSVNEELVGKKIKDQMKGVKRMYFLKLNQVNKKIVTKTVKNTNKAVKIITTESLIQTNKLMFAVTIEELGLKMQRKEAIKKRKSKWKICFELKIKKIHMDLSYLKNLR